MAMALGLSLYLILIVSAGFYHGYFQFWWKQLVNASGFFDHFAAIFGFLFISFMAFAIFGFLFAMAFMGAHAHGYSVPPRPAQRRTRA